MDPIYVLPEVIRSGHHAEMERDMVRSSESGRPEFPPRHYTLKAIHKDLRILEDAFRSESPATLPTFAPALLKAAPASLFFVGDQGYGARPCRQSTGPIRRVRSHPACAASHPAPHTAIRWL